MKAFSNEIIATDPAHRWIHAGRAFFVGRLWSEHAIPSSEAIADDGNADLLVQVGASELHIIQAQAAGGDAEIFVYRDTTITDAGISLTTFNKRHKFEGIVTSNAAITYDPVIDTLGTLYPPLFSPGGQGGTAIGGSDGSFNRENVLAPDTTYLFRSVNRSGQVRTMSMLLEYYEPEVNNV